MSKIAEIIETGLAPGLNTKAVDERNPDKAVPRALKSLDSRQVNQLLKESGKPASHFKRAWGLLVAATLLLSATLVCGQDLNAGYQFTTTDRVTATKLNNLMGLGTINPAFISDKAAATPIASDNFIFYRSGVLYRTPFSGMSLNNTNLIWSQTEDPMPAADDYLLTLNMASGQFRKSQINSVVLTNIDLIGTRTANTAPSPLEDWFLAYNSGTGDYSRVNRSNFLADTFSLATWTNLTSLAASAQDTNTFPIFDAANGVNKQVSLSGLVSLTPINTTNNDASYVMVVTNGVVSRIAQSNFIQSILPSVAVEKFVSSDFGFSTAGNVNSEAHTLSGTPTVVYCKLVCTDAAGDIGYSQNDEVSAMALQDTTTGANYLNFGANSTTVWVINRTASASTYGILNKSTGVAAAITASKWRFRITALYYP